MTAVSEVESNVSEFYDLHCEPDGGATGTTGTFGHVPTGEHRIELNVTDDIGRSNTTRKHIIVTGS